MCGTSGNPAMLIDTDVLIWLFRGRESAREAVERCSTVELSAITYMELVQGARNRNEQRLLQQTIKASSWRVALLTENISQRAAMYIESHALADELRLADALVAATAVERGVALLTANVRHYRFLPGLSLQRYRP